jgi:hypothetical protein
MGQLIVFEPRRLVLPIESLMDLKAKFGIDRAESV